MNAIAKAWRNFRIRVANRRHGIAENKFKIGDRVVAREPTLFQPLVSLSHLGSNHPTIYLHSQNEGKLTEAGEVVDAFYGFDMIAGWRWHYKVSYKKRDTVIVLYEEQEICIDPAWIRDKKIKELGI